MKKPAFILLSLFLLLSSLLFEYFFLWHFTDRILHSLLNFSVFLSSLLSHSDTYSSPIQSWLVLYWWAASSLGCSWSSACCWCLNSLWGFWPIAFCFVIICLPTTALSYVSLSASAFTWVGLNFWIYIYIYSLKTCHKLYQTPLNKNSCVSFQIIKWNLIKQTMKCWIGQDLCFL